MAWRNVWRNRRRSTVTITAMTLALLAMILYAGLMEGYLRAMERNVLDLEVGDLQIFAGDYRENPSIWTRIEDPEALLAPLHAAGFRATPRLLAFGLAAADDASAGISFRGIDIERDARVSLIHEQLADGSWLDPADPSGVVLGRRLARTLNVAPGAEILVFSSGADGSMAYDLYRVRGVLRGVSDATDRSGVFMTADAFRELMVVPRGVHQIIVRRPSELELGAAASLLSDLASGLDVRTWRQLLPTLSALMDSSRAVIFALFFITYLAVGILILNAMLMAVFERVRELGVLKALGVGPYEVLGLIVIESGIQTGFALVLGVAASVPGLLYLERVGIDLSAGISIMGIAMDPIWRATFHVGAYTGPIAALLVIVALAVIYPALKAALIQPVEAIRYH